MSIYRRAGNLYFMPTSGTLAICPIHRIEASASLSEVGEMALKTLSDCKPLGAVSWPTDWEAHGAPILAGLEVDSWGEVTEGGDCVELDREGDRFVTSPTLNMGPGEGFGPMPPELSITTPAGSQPEVIGEVIVRAFGSCARHTGGDPWWYKPLIEP